MRVAPNSNDRAFAISVHDRFAAMPGSEFIASCEALSHLAALLRTRDVNSVIEFGAGIGTITYMLLTYPEPSRRVISTETNQFCLKQLAVNIPDELKSRLTVISDGSETEGDFDLAIFDGELKTVKGYDFLKPGVIGFIEGGRAHTHAIFDRIMRRKGLKCLFRYHAPRHLPQLEWSRGKSGTKITCKIPPWRKLFTYKSGCAIGVVRRRSYFRR